MPNPIDRPSPMVREDMTRVPRLLVSVRDVREAVAALRGGADVIDVKEPARGSLGRPEARVVEAIVHAVGDESAHVPISVALGETNEVKSIMDYVIPAGVTYGKLGLAHLDQVSESPLDDWTNARLTFDDQSQSDIRWVAVIYADGCGSPPALDIIQAAAGAANCDGVLIDTSNKRAGGVLAHAGVRELRQFAEHCRERNLFFAVAGRLSIDDLSKLTDVQPDVVAIRSAACDGDDRTQCVSRERVRQFRHRLTETFGPLPHESGTTNQRRQV